MFSRLKHIWNWRGREAFLAIERVASGDDPAAEADTLVADVVSEEPPSTGLLVSGIVILSAAIAADSLLLGGFGLLLAGVPIFNHAWQRRLRIDPHEVVIRTGPWGLRRRTFDAERWWRVSTQKTAVDGVERLVLEMKDGTTIDAWDATPAHQAEVLSAVDAWRADYPAASAPRAAPLVETPLVVPPPIKRRPRVHERHGVRHLVEGALTRYRVGIGARIGLVFAVATPLVIAEYLLEARIDGLPWMLPLVVRSLAFAATAAIPFHGYTTRLAADRRRFVALRTGLVFTRKREWARADIVGVRHLTSEDPRGDAVALVLHDGSEALVARHLDEEEAVLIRTSIDDWFRSLPAHSEVGGPRVRVAVTSETISTKDAEAPVSAQAVTKRESYT